LTINLKYGQIRLRSPLLRSVRLRWPKLYTLSLLPVIFLTGVTDKYIRSLYFHRFTVRWDTVRTVRHTVLLVKILFILLGYYSYNTLGIIAVIIGLFNTIFLEVVIVYILVSDTWMCFIHQYTYQGNTNNSREVDKITK